MFQRQHSKSGSKQSFEILLRKCSDVTIDSDSKTDKHTSSIKGPRVCHSQFASTKGYLERAASLVKTSEALTAAIAEADRENGLSQIRGLSDVHTSKRVKWRAPFAMLWPRIVRGTTTLAELTQLELL